MITQTRADANAVMDTILATAGLAANDVGRLRELSASNLLALPEQATPRSKGVAYGPVADGAAVPLDPLGAIGAGSAIGIPLLVGTKLEERKFQRRLDPGVEGLSDDALLTRLADAQVNARTGDTARYDPAEAVPLYRDAGAARGESNAAEELWLAMLSDRRYRVPALLFAETHAVHTPETYIPSVHLKIAGLQRQTRRRTRGRGSIRLRDVQCARFTAAGA